MAVLPPLIYSVSLEINRRSHPLSKGRESLRAQTPDHGGHFESLSAILGKLFLTSLTKFHLFHVHNVFQPKIQCRLLELFLCVASSSVKLCPQIVATSALLSSHLCLPNSEILLCSLGSPVSISQSRNYFQTILAVVVLISFASLLSDYSLSLRVLYLWWPSPLFSLACHPRVVLFNLIFKTPICIIVHLVSVLICPHFIGVCIHYFFLHLRGSSRDNFPSEIDL